MNVRGGREEIEEYVRGLGYAPCENLQSLRGRNKNIHITLMYISINLPVRKILSSFCGKEIARISVQTCLCGLVFQTTGTV